jgi:hypothetical protein
MSVPDGMTSEKLRAIADWFDTYDKMAKQYFTILENNGRTGTEKAREACDSDEIQAELRYWADLIDERRQAEVDMISWLYDQFTHIRGQVRAAIRIEGGSTGTERKVMDIAERAIATIDAMEGS